MTTHRPAGTPGVEPAPVADRLWSLVDRSDPDGCWPWTRSTDRKGYGRIMVGSRLDGSKRVEFAHRVAYVETYGEPPDDRPFVCHRCDNPPCCRPDHLYAGDRADNARDWTERGTGNRGADNPAARIDHETAEAIRLAYANGHGGLTQREVADLYDVSQTTVWQIVNYRSWRPLDVSS